MTPFATHGGMIGAAPSLLPEIIRFLREDVENALLPLSELARFGLGGDHTRALDIWVRWQGGRVCDVLAMNKAGLVLPQCPNTPWSDCAAVLKGREITSILGPQPQVRGLVAACDLGQRPSRLDRDEPYLTLSLDALQVPAGAGRVVPMAQAPRDVILGWLAAYLQETLGLGADLAEIAARDDYQSYCDEQSHVVLVEGEMPLCMSGFSGHQPSVVQVGGVYTPPEMRGLGLARRALALHLAQARADGVARAVLSAASPAALRAYRGIGFRQTGVWSLCLFDPPAQIAA